MGLLGAAVTAVGSLIGGRKAAKEQRRLIAAQNAYNDPSAIRARAEKAGFNPLLFVGPGVGLQTDAGQPVMGQAIANAAMAIGNGIDDLQAANAQRTALEAQNAELRKALETATIRPKVGGVIGAGPVMTPRTPAGIDLTVMSGAPAAGVGGNTPATTPGAIPVTENPIAIPEGFERENAPIPSGYIWMEGIDGSGNRFAVPGFNGEILEAEQLPVLGGSWFWDRWKSGGPGKALTDAGSATGSAIRQGAISMALKAHGLKPLVTMPGAPIEPGFNVRAARDYNPWQR